MSLSTNQKLFVKETLEALLTGGARIGQKHYTVTISQNSVGQIIEDMEDGEDEIWFED